MAQKRGEGEKIEAFRRLLVEKPHADPVKLAKEAGYTRPKQAWDRIRLSDAKAEEPPTGAWSSFTVEESTMCQSVTYLPSIPGKSRFIDPA